MKFTFKILLIFFLFFGTKLNSQLSKVHYIPPMTASASGANSPHDQWIYISTPSVNPVNFTVKKPDGTTFFSGQVSNTDSQEFSAGPNGFNGNLFVRDFETEQILTNAGFIIEAEEEIYVSIRVSSTPVNFCGNQGCHGGALVSKGESALGTKFRLGALQIRQNNQQNFGSVMATENQTIINIQLPSGQTMRSGNNSATVTLNAGESYVFSSEDSSSPGYGIIGTLIESNKPIVVSCGSATGSFAVGSNSGGQDYGIDQIVGADKVGSEYIFVKGEGGDSWENILLISDQNNTTINVNGNPLTINGNAVVLQEGQFIIIEGNNFSDSQTMFVNTNNSSDKLFAYQGIGDTYTGGSGNSPAARQGMFFVPPLSCAAKGSVDNIAEINRVGKDFENGVVTIVTKENAVVQVNGLALNNQPNTVTVSGPLEVSGKDYEVYIVKGLTGDVKVTGNDELYVAYFNFNSAATTGSFYSGFVTPPSFDSDLSFDTLGSCIKKNGESNIILKAKDVSNFTSFEWEILDNGNFISTGISAVEYTPTQSGTYRLKGILDCSESTFVSPEITVFICADDFDNDGIIDNIDLDSDNDGISNGYESLGDGYFDFSNLSNPDLILNNDPSNTISSVASVDIPENSHTQTGGNNYISSSINPGRDQEVNININFNEKLNIKISESSAFEINPNDNEEFEVKVLPTESSITLLDPDKNLLIYINGVWQEIDSPLTNNTIRFKYKSRVNNTFEFHASKVDGVSFKHLYNNITSTDESIFAPKIEVTSYYLNTDGTDSEDMFDMDSDNDGCNDVIEAGYSDQDDDGIFGLGLPTIENGGVTSRGQIISDNYDPTSAPRNYLNNSNIPVYYFQEFATAPTISLQPESTIACQVGNSVQFSVDVTSNDSPIYFSWYVSTADQPNSWTEIVDNITYSGSKTNTLSIDDVQLNMDGNKYRVQINTDNYACIQETDDNVTLDVEEALPVVNTVDNLILCDDNSFGTDTDGINSGINLRSNVASILGNNQNVDDFTVSFHLSEASASDISDLGILNSENYTNTNRQEPIYVRVQNNTSLCYNYVKSFDLIIAELPVIINPILTIEQCDSDEDNNGKTKFNLSEYENLISTEYENETFEYYTDPNYTEKISDPTDFENTTLFSQSIYVKIITDQNCFRESRIDLKIGASLIDPNFMENFSKCETSPSNSQDGIELWDSSIFIDLNTKLVASDSKFSDQNITITYYSSEEDALIKSNNIDFNDPSFSYSNLTPNIQEIWASIEVNDLDTVTCLGLKQVATLYVEPRPIANPVTIDRQCDGDSPLDLDSQDGLYPFDVSLIEDQVINGQTGVTVTYFNEDGTQIENFSPTFSTASQTITIRVERDPSYPNITNPDGLCYDETTLEFIVDDSPEIFPITIAAQCDDGADDNDGFSEFDTSNIINSLMGPSQNLTNYSISFTYTNEFGNTITSAELPNPFNTKTQTVTATISNNINTTCSISTEIDFIVNPLPTFTVDDDTIVCLNLPPIPIGVSSAEAEYTYAWEHEDLNGNRSPFPSSGSTIFIGVGGTYFVTATTTDGTNCSRTLSIDVEESIIATVTLDDITVEDLTSDNNNTITIDPTNLGIGDYEYAIDDPNGPYQNEPFFDGVRPGIHTIYIRDKNDCGIAQIDVSVIGYKKFFTPNGDGIHDTWRILGIRQDFQPNSKVYIFDRYGKLLKDLDPISVGWDGTYIGRPMPQTDYWFRVFLEDGREFKGHFSLIRGK